MLRVSAVLHEDADGRDRYGFQLVNDGNTTAHDVRYELETPEGLRQRIGLQFAVTCRMANPLTSFSEREKVVVFSQNLVGSLRPGESLQLSRSLALRGLLWTMFQSGGERFPQRLPFRKAANLLHFILTG